MDTMEEDYNNINVSLWSIENVGEWLKEIGLDILIENFEDKKVDGKALLEIKKENHEDYGLNKYTIVQKVHFIVSLDKLKKLYSTTTTTTSAKTLTIVSSPSGYVELKEYLFTKVGEGGFGEVFKLVNKNDSSIIMAMKKIPLSKNPKAFRETEILSKLKHENIIEIKSFQKDQSYLYIFFEYIQHSIRSVYKSKGAFSEPECRPIVEKILKGLDHIHSNNIVHRDLKSDNILLDKMEPKIIDFGLSYNFKDNFSGFKTRAGTEGWQAPEVRLKKTELNGRSCDIWSLGCTIVEMLVADNPWLGLDVSKGSHPPIPSDISVYFRDFLNLCFVISPSFRPSAKMLLEHPWIRGEQDIILSSQENNITLKNIIKEYEKYSAIYHFNGLKLDLGKYSNLNYTKAICYKREEKTFNDFKEKNPEVFNRIINGFYNFIEFYSIVKIGHYFIHVNHSFQKAFKSFDSGFILQFMWVKENIDSFISSGQIKRNDPNEESIIVLSIYKHMATLFTNYLIGNHAKSFHYSINVSD